MIFRKDLESPLIFILFLKGKIKWEKKTLSVTLEEKTGLWKTKFGSKGQVTHWEGTVVSRSTPLSPYTYGLY